MTESELSEDRLADIEAGNFNIESVLEAVPQVIARLRAAEAENARLRAAWKIAEPHLPELKYRQALAALRELRDTATDVCARVELGGQP